MATERDAPGEAVPPVRTLSDRAAEAPPGQQILARKVKTRRRWAFRTVLILAISAVLLCLLVMWRRDETAKTGQLQSLAELAATLQAQVNELGRLPAIIPEPSLHNLDFYASDADRFYASRVSQPVIIAGTQPIHLLLTEDGRAVIIYQQGKIGAKWMTASEFEKAWDTQEAKITAFEQERKSSLPNLP